MPVRNFLKLWLCGVAREINRGFISFLSYFVEKILYLLNENNILPIPVKKLIANLLIELLI